MEQLYNSTIAAISTAMSNSGIGIVRMSGPEAFQIADRVYKGKKEKKLCEQQSHTIHYGYMVDGDQVIDEVLVMLMRGPHSYTGEDTVEINCHGGVFVTRKILETVIKYGARPAEPGEFSKRAGRVHQACVSKWQTGSFTSRGCRGPDRIAERICFTEFSEPA